MANNIASGSPPVQPCAPVGAPAGTPPGSLGGPVAGAAAVAAPTAPVSVTAATADGGAVPLEVTPMDVDVARGIEIANILHANGPLSSE